MPGRGVTSAECALRTPYGTARCRWSIDGTRFSFEALVPPNTTATAVLPGGDGVPRIVAAGTHRWDYEVDLEVVEGWADEG